MKRIITCSDGTWNKPDQKDEGVVSPSNVSKFYKQILENGTDGIKQVSFYDEGVGTEWYDKITGGLFGMGINKNIIQAYQFIAKNYEQGDEIYLTGFSRGAYTARSVAGFIRNSGLLRKEFLASELEEAFTLYKRRDDKSHPNSDDAKEFRKKYCYDNVRIKFIGVWDTVGELGIPLDVFDEINKDVLNCRFYDVELSGYVDFAYHALAIDEHRKAFLPTLWEQQAESNQAGQIMEQVWFTGVHCDVGGGYNENGLSNCTLYWMIEKAKRVGLQFNEDKVIAQDPYDEMHNSMKFYYEIFGRVNRKMEKKGIYNETVSPTVYNRLNLNTNNYKSKSNPNLAKFINSNN